MRTRRNIGNNRHDDIEDYSNYANQNHCIHLHNRMTLLTTIMTSALLACGCSGGDGPAKYPVSGKVTVNGQPVETGSINFFPDIGATGNSAGAEIKNGEYYVPGDAGLTPGRHKVQIRATRGTGQMVHPGMGAPESARVERMEQFIPRIYNSQTTLVVDIEAGDNDGRDFDLTIK